MHTVSTVEIMDQLQRLHECEGFQARSAVNPLAADSHCQPIRKLGAKNERDMTTFAHHPIKNRIRHVAAFVNECPSKRNRIVDNDAQ